MGTISINGKTYRGNNITMKNGKVIIDGKEQVDGSKSPELYITILEGSIDKVKSDSSIEIIGNIAGDADAGSSLTCGQVGGNVNAGSSVKCDNVVGSVDAGSSVTCGDVGKNVDSGGSVKCGKVNGRIDAGGSVRHS